MGEVCSRAVLKLAVDDFEGELSASGATSLCCTSSIVSSSGSRVSWCMLPAMSWSSLGGVVKLISFRCEDSASLASLPSALGNMTELSSMTCVASSSCSKRKYDDEVGNLYIIKSV